MIDINDWNGQIVAEYRSSGGRLRWSNAEDVAAGRPIPASIPGFSESDAPPIILVHNFGARTGQERINPLAYLPVGDNFAVFASFGGSPRHPIWYLNLLAHPAVTVEAGKETIPVTARVAEGEERARIWSAQVAAIPVFADYQAATAREIPVVLLERTG